MMLSKEIRFMCLGTGVDTWRNTDCPPAGDLMQSSIDGAVYEVDGPPLHSLQNDGDGMVHVISVPVRVPESAETGQPKPSDDSRVLFSAGGNGVELYSFCRMVLDLLPVAFQEGQTHLSSLWPLLADIRDKLEGHALQRYVIDRLVLDARLAAELAPADLVPVRKLFERWSYYMEREGNENEAEAKPLDELTTAEAIDALAMALEDWAQMIFDLRSPDSLHRAARPATLAVLNASWYRNLAVQLGERSGLEWRPRKKRRDGPPPWSIADAALKLIDPTGVEIDWGSAAKAVR